MLTAKNDYLCRQKCDKVMETTVFTPAQEHLLHMMSYIRTPEELEALERVLSEYFAKRVDEEMDKLWEEGKVSEEIIEQWGKEHMRTPYTKG